MYQLLSNHIFIGFEKINLQILDTVFKKLKVTFHFCEPIFKCTKILFNLVVLNKLHEKTEIKMLPKRKKKMSFFNN